MLRSLGLFLLLAVLLGACASRIPEPVPESGAYSLRYIEADYDHYVRVERVGAPTAQTLAFARHPERRLWSAAQWDRFGATLFPNDEIDFDQLRILRGSSLIPAGVASPAPTALGACRRIDHDDYAKVQQRVIRLAENPASLGSNLALVTSCSIHEGLNSAQLAAVHQRPNPYRLPTRYETVVDLDRDGRAEQRSVSLSNVSRDEIQDFIDRETGLSTRAQRALNRRLERY
jgi:hypothetical protein